MDKSSGVESITISALGKSVTVTPEEFDYATRNAGRLVREQQRRDQAMAPQEKRVVLGGDPDRPAPIPSEQEFKDEGGFISDFLPADIVQQVARSLVADRPELEHIEEVTVAYLWRARGGTSQSKVVMGKTQKPSGLLRHFSGVDFVIWLGADNCRERRMTVWELEALVYHELLHIAPPDEDGVITIRGHEFEGFSDELRTYGDWHTEYQSAKRAFEQLPLFE